MGQVGLSVAFALALSPLIRPTALKLLASDRFVATALSVLYDDTQVRTPTTAAPSLYQLRVEAQVAEVDPRFLSVAIDASQVAGGHFWSADGHVELLVGSTRQAPFDFTRAGLAPLTAALAPAYLRIGGTEADAVYYAPTAAEPKRDAALPQGYDLRLTRNQWDAVNGFVRRTGLDLMFTVNAGPGPRDKRGDWRPHQLEPLLRYSREQGYEVPVWELGNEVNAFWLTHGVRAHVGGQRYAADFERFRRAVQRHFPQAKVAGAAAFAWPVMGESPPALVEPFLRHSQQPPDIVTWHYYPQQSRRCWSATRRASPERLLEPAYLDEFGRWSEHFLDMIDDQEMRPSVELWLGETGGAQCGGEPGVSDRYASSLWWLDQLGMAARSGQPVVVRQTLVGADYGLLDPTTLRPRPDYWASLLWKRLMGTRVLEVTAQASNPHLRVYAHCHADGSGRPVVFALNLTQSHQLALQLAGQGEGGELFEVTARGLQAETVLLNGMPLQQLPSGALPELRGRKLKPLEVSAVGQGTGAKQVTRVIAPLGYTFWVLPQSVEACQGQAPTHNHAAL